MSRKSRKFPPTKNKERREKRKEAGANKQRAAKHLQLVNRKHTNSDDASENGLALMEARGLISSMQKSAGLAFGELSYQFKQQLIKTNDTPTYARQLIANGSISNPVEMIEAQQEEQQKFYYAMSDRLDSVGAMANDEVRHVVCNRKQIDLAELYHAFKPWAIKEMFTKEPLNFMDKRQKAAFLTGLNVLIKR